jgi:hypothetical protein
LGVAQAAPGAGTFIPQVIEAQKKKTLPPLAHRRQRNMHTAGHFGVAQPSELSSTMRARNVRACANCLCLPLI